MTVVSLGDHQVLEQIQKQLGKLEDVHDIKELREGHSVYRELMLVKVRANANQRMAINAISEIFRASIVDVGKDSVTVMLTGDQSKQDALITHEKYEELERLQREGKAFLLCPTGRAKVGRLERDPQRLEALYLEGRKAMLDALPALREFLAK